MSVRPIQPKITSLSFNQKTLNTKYKIICIKYNFIITVTSNNTKTDSKNNTGKFFHIPLRSEKALGLNKMYPLPDRRLVVNCTVLVPASWCQETLVCLSTDKA